MAYPTSWVSWFKNFHSFYFDDKYNNIYIFRILIKFSTNWSRDNSKKIDGLASKLNPYFFLQLNLTELDLITNK